MAVKEIISIVFIFTGVLFMLISAIGMIRLPDFYIRNSASAKSMSLGLMLILLGIAVFYNEISLLLQIAAIMFFILLITPLSAHIIARAAFKLKVPFWKHTNKKDAGDYYRKEEQSADLSKNSSGR